jgi:hypothetical protein
VRVEQPARETGHTLGQRLSPGRQRENAPPGIDPALGGCDGNPIEGQAMIATSPQGPDTVRAEFRLRCGVGRHEVCVVGEFNDWSRTANPMTFDGYAYVAEIIIATGRTYRFRYLIDNERWQIDWAADSHAANEIGGGDGILDLT